MDSDSAVRPSLSVLDRLSGAESSGPNRDYFTSAVLRDLSWLFNCVAPLGLDDREVRRRFPRAASSILGYGLRGVLGRIVHDPTEIQRLVESALRAFEPRLRVEEMSLKITRGGQLVEIEIKGVLLAHRSERKIWIRTDLETLESRLRTE